MFVFNPDPYLMPSYRISPFATSDVGFNHSLPDNNFIDTYFNDRFNGRKYYFTLNGRAAINIALSHYNLQKDDIVTVLTTTGNFYISGCVTKEIENFCKWSRKIEPLTKVILVNHEFGYPCKDLLALKELGIPIIEDCAHSFFSFDEKKIIGTVGDFVIYSFPKMFPIQIGGLLLSNIDDEIKMNTFISKEEIQYIKNVLSHYICNKNEITEKRLINYYSLSHKLKEIGLNERFDLLDDIIPGVFMFQKGNHQIELSELKKHLYLHGIQCSVFYGEESFFIPVHQNLSEVDIEYFISVIKIFLK